MDVIDYHEQDPIDPSRRAGINYPGQVYETGKAGSCPAIAAARAQSRVHESSYDGCDFGLGSGWIIKVELKDNATCTRQNATIKDLRFSFLPPAKVFFKRRSVTYSTAVGSTYTIVPAEALRLAEAYASGGVEAAMDEMIRSKKHGIQNTAVQKVYNAEKAGRPAYKGKRRDAIDECSVKKANSRKTREPRAASGRKRKAAVCFDNSDPAHLKAVAYDAARHAKKRAAQQAKRQKK
jgi:hypothetical protein